MQLYARLDRDPRHQNIKISLISFYYNILSFYIVTGEVILVISRPGRVPAAAPVYPEPVLGGDRPLPGGEAALLLVQLQGGMHSRGLQLLADTGSVWLGPVVLRKTQQKSGSNPEAI